MGPPLKDSFNERLPLLLGVESVNSKEEFMKALQDLLMRTKYKIENLPLNLLEITAATLNVDRLKVYNLSELIQEILLGLDKLLQKNIEIIEGSNNLSDLIKNTDDLPISSLSNIKFISYYLYFSNMPAESTAPMAKFISRLAPETVLSIVTLMYLLSR